MEIKESLTLQADGSGDIELHVKMKPEVSEQARMVIGFVQSDSNPKPIYPPFSVADAHKLFPGKSFTIGSVKKDSDSFSVKIHFNSVNDLLRSPYAEARAMAMKRKNGRLIVRSATGIHAKASLLNIKNEYSIGYARIKKDSNISKEPLSYSFSLTLPGDVTAEDADIKGNTATWNVRKDVLGEGETLSSALQSTMIASCPDKGIDWTLPTIARISCASFDDVEEVASDGDASRFDKDVIRKAAKWIPIQFVLTRTFDLNGDGYAENNCNLQGAVELPLEFAPSRWGKSNIVKAIDDMGNNLVKNPENDGPFGGRSLRFGNSSSTDTVSLSVARHFLTFELKLPDPESSVIEKFEGELSLYYPGTKQAIKLPGIVKFGNRDEDGSVNFELQQQEEHPLLKKNRLKIEKIYGFTHEDDGLICLSTKSRRGARISAVEVYDVHGKPYFSTMEVDEDDGSININYVGNPKGPLSLTCMLESGGQEVKVPIVMENIPLHKNESASTKQAQKNVK